MKKKLLTTLVAAIMTVTCVTSISAATTATYCPDCGDGMLVGVGCAFRSLNSCETATTTCADHADCTAVMYFADTISECNGCDTVFSGEEMHLHALGHRLDGESYEYEMNTICRWF